MADTENSIEESGIPEITMQLQAVQDVIEAAVDNTLTIEGEAAEAKATGDRIRALEARTAEDIPMNDEPDAESIADAIEALDEKTGSDIASATGTGVPTIAAALATLEAKTGSDIASSSTDSTTIASALASLGGKTGSDIAVSSTDSTKIAVKIAAIDATISGLITAHFNQIYPVGSIYITTGTVGAPTIGTWEEVYMTATWDNLKGGTRTFSSIPSGGSPSGSSAYHFWRRTVL